MVDEDIIEQSPLAKEALKMLHASGIFSQQIERITASFLEGDTDEPIADVTKRVIESRRRISNLRTLDDLGAQYNQERE